MKSTVMNIKNEQDIEEDLLIIKKMNGEII
jgi:hypothetical protein